MNYSENNRAMLFVGLGSIGQRHLRNLRKLIGCDQKIIAYRVRNTTPMLDEHRQIVQGEEICSFYNVDGYDTLDGVLAKKPMLAFICNPSSEHVEVATELAKTGCHLFIEKPLGTELTSIDTLMEVVDEQKAVAMVGCQMRFHPGLEKVDSWLNQNVIGQVISAQIVHGEYLPNFHPYEGYEELYASRKDQGGGVILTQIHEIDYALWLFGIPDSVYCVGGKLSDLRIDVEDTASIILGYQRGESVVPVTISIDYLRNPAQRSCTIVGENGKIVLDFYGSMSARMQNWVTGVDEEISFKTFEVNNLFVNELDHFLKTIASRGIPKVTLMDGYNAVKVALLAHESMSTGLPQING